MCKYTDACVMRRCTRLRRPQDNFQYCSSGTIQAVFWEKVFHGVYHVAYLASQSKGSTSLCFPSTGTTRVPWPVFCNLSSKDPTLKGLSSTLLNQLYTLLRNIFEKWPSPDMVAHVYNTSAEAGGLPSVPSQPGLHIVSLKLSRAI